MSDTSRSPSVKYTSSKGAPRKHLLALPLVVKLLVVAITKVWNVYSKDATIDNLNILQHPSFSVEQLNTIITVFWKSAEGVL